MANHSGATLQAFYLTSSGAVKQATKGESKGRVANGGVFEKKTRVGWEWIFRDIITGKQHKRFHVYHDGQLIVIGTPPAGWTPPPGAVSPGATPGGAPGAAPGGPARPPIAPATAGRIRVRIENQSGRPIKLFFKDGALWSPAQFFYPSGPPLTPVAHGKYTDLDTRPYTEWKAQSASPPSAS